MNIKANISISRMSNDKISITVRDDTSFIQFLELTMQPADLANALTGLGHVACAGEVRGLEYVGKSCIREKRQVEYPHGGGPKRHELEAWLLLNCQEDGWIVEPYLGSQSSIYTVGGKTFLNYHVKRYVEVEEAST